MGGQLAELEGRGPNAKLEQLGAQQVEPVPRAAQPHPGDSGGQRLPASGTQPVPAWLPRLPSFPRCHLPSPPPPRSAPGQCPGFLAQEGMPFACHPWVPRLLRHVTTSNQEAPGRAILSSGQQEPQSRPHPLPGNFWSWETGTWTLWLPTAPHTHTAPRLGQNFRLRAAGSVGVPPAPVLGALEEGLQNWVTASAPHSCCHAGPSPSLRGSPELHPSRSPSAGISFNLKQVPGIPALAESTLPPTRPLPRRLPLPVHGS